MMDENVNNLWNKFQMSGRVSDYLEYSTRRAQCDLSPLSEESGVTSKETYSCEKEIKSGDIYEDKGAGYYC